MGTTFIVNPGSTSRKYALYRDGACIVVLYFESLPNDSFSMSVIRNGVKEKEYSLTKEEYTHSIAHALSYLQDNRDIATVDEIVLAGVRVVCPGTFFVEHKEIDSQYIDTLKEKQDVAPLHIPELLSEIENLQKILPHTLLYGISDSAFHNTIPKHIRTISVPKEDAELYDLRRFGYHGVSFSSIVHNYKKQYGNIPGRSIVCHIGGGVSIAALKDGKSIATSMGYSPVSGLMMGSRGGDITPGVVAALTSLKQLKGKELYEYLYKKSGFQGVAGIHDLRVLLERKASADEDAELAVDMFIHQIRSWIGSHAVLLGGVDVLILTATASVRNPYLRKLILSDLSILGIEFDEQKNDALIGAQGYIHTQQSDVKVLVMKTDEMGEIDRQCRKLSKKN